MRSTTSKRPVSLKGSGGRPADVEADPDDQRQDGGQSMGIGAFRVGHRRRLEATDLVVFATARATSPLRLVLARR